VRATLERRERGRGWYYLPTVSPSRVCRVAECITASFTSSASGSRLRRALTTSLGYGSRALATTGITSAGRNLVKTMIFRERKSAQREREGEAERKRESDNHIAVKRKVVLSRLLITQTSSRVETALNSRAPRNLRAVERIYEQTEGLTRDNTSPVAPTPASNQPRNKNARSTLSAPLPFRKQILEKFESPRRWRAKSLKLYRHANREG